MEGIKVEHDLRQKCPSHSCVRVWERESKPIKGRRRNGYILVFSQNVLSANQDLWSQFWGVSLLCHWHTLRREKENRSQTLPANQRLSVFFFSTGGRWERVRVAFNLLLVIFFSFLLLLPNTFLWGMMCVSSTSTAARRNLGRTPGCRCCSSYWSSRPLAVTAAERLAATPSSADWSSGVVLNPVG